MQSLNCYVIRPRHRDTFNRCSSSLINYRNLAQFRMVAVDSFNSVADDKPARDPEGNTMG